MESSDSDAVVGTAEREGTAGRWARWFVLAGALAYAWACRFIQDDAFISFRYARNLVEGHGLVFNPGERVEGYTNFLWTMICTIPFLLEVDPVIFVQVLGLFLFAGTLAVTGAIVRDVVGRGWDIVAVAYLGSHYTFAAYATGGLETQLQALLAASGLLVALRALASTAPTPALLAGFSVLAGLSVLGRMDAVLLLAPAGCLLAARAVRAPHGVGHVLVLVSPAGLLVGGWFAWKLQYYGDILPNTWYAKAGSSASALRGLGFVFEYVRSYLLAAVLLGCGARIWHERGRVELAPGLLLATLALWLAYLVKVGGDFMEFRFMVPVAPLVAVMLVWGVSAFRRTAGGFALALIPFVGNVRHPLTFEFHPWLQIEPVSTLHHHVVSPAEDWREMGIALGKRLPSRSSVTVAVTAAGAIPFYSRLRTIDMLGLTEPEVARNGVPMSDRPGHQRIATLEYLESKGVNLLIGHPTMEDRVWIERGGPGASDLDYVLERMWTWFALPRGRAPRHAELVGVPLSGGRYLIAVYLVPHPDVDAAIARGGWLRWPLAVAADRPPEAVADALTTFERPPFSDPGFRSTRLGLGEILYQWGRLDDAESAFTNALDSRGIGGAEDRHLNTWAWFWLGRVAEARGDFEAAETRFRRAADVEPANYAARVGLAWSHIERGDCETALPLLASVLEVAPGDVPARAGLERCRP